MWRLACTCLSSDSGSGNFLRFFAKGTGRASSIGWSDRKELRAINYFENWLSLRIHLCLSQWFRIRHASLSLDVLIRDASLSLSPSLKDTSGAFCVCLLARCSAIAARFLKKKDRLTNRCPRRPSTIVVVLIILLVNDLETLIGRRDDQRHEPLSIPYTCEYMVNLRISILDIISSCGLEHAVTCGE